MVKYAFKAFSIVVRTNEFYDGMGICFGFLTYIVSILASKASGKC